MARIILTSLITLCIGVAAGAVAVHLGLNGELQDSLQARKASDLALSDLERTKLEQGARIAGLEGDNASLQGELERLWGEHDAALATAREIPLDGIEDTALASVPLDEATELAEPNNPEERRRAWREQWGTEEGRARRDEFIGQMRDRQNTLIDELMYGATPEEQERIAALVELQNVLNDLRSQVRGAETDEDREYLIAQMQEASRDAREVAQEQKNSMISDVVAEFGIEDEDVGKLVEQLTETMNDPLFRLDAALSQGRGGPGGGRRGSSFGGQGGSFGGGRGIVGAGDSRGGRRR